MPMYSWLKRALSWATGHGDALGGSDDTPHRRVSTRHLDLIPGQLSIDIYSHEVQTNTGPLACWSYVSQGLQQLGQPEIVFSLIKKRGEAVAPQEPVKLVRTVHKGAQGGTIIEAGGLQRFPKGDFFGRHVVYIAAQQLPDVVIPSGAICAVLVTEDEVQAAKMFGATRVIARLGLAARYYPCPPWSDRSRPGIDFAAVRRSSLLLRAGPLPMLLTSCSVYQTKESIVLLLDDVSRKHITKLIEGMPDECAFGLHAGIDPLADGCLVWIPGQDGPAAISPPGSSGQRVCGGFLVVTTGQAEDDVRQVEDGFAALLTAASWRAMKNAVLNGEPIRIDAANPAAMPLVVEFATSPDTASNG